MNAALMHAILLSLVIPSTVHSSSRGWCGPRTDDRLILVHEWVFSRVRCNMAWVWVLGPGWVGTGHWAHETPHHYKHSCRGHTLKLCPTINDRSIVHPSISLSTGSWRLWQNFFWTFCCNKPLSCKRTHFSTFVTFHHSFERNVFSVMEHHREPKHDSKQTANSKQHSSTFC